MATKIAITAGDTKNVSAAAMRLHRITGDSVGEIKARLQSGAPVVERLLFKRDHDEVVHVLRQAMAELPGDGAQVRVFELGADERLQDIPDRSHVEISPEVFETILQEHQRGLEELEEEDEYDATS